MFIEEKIEDDNYYFTLENIKNDLINYFNDLKDVT